MNRIIATAVALAFSTMALAQAPATKADVKADVKATVKADSKAPMKGMSGKAMSGMESSHGTASGGESAGGHGAGVSKDMPGKTMAALGKPTGGESMGKDSRKGIRTSAISRARLPRMLKCLPVVNNPRRSSCVKVVACTSP